MNATNSKSAAASTPGAESPASQAEETQGANTAETGDLDISGALGLPAEGQETETDKAAVVDPDAEATKADDESDDEAEDGAEKTDAAEDESGKSDEAAAQSDEAEEESGASEEEGTEAAAEEEAPAEGNTPAWAQKRFDELTAARRTAEDEAKSLREQNATLKAAASGTLQASPLDFIETPDQLADHKRDVEKLQEWAIRNRNGGKLGEKEYDSEQVAAIEAETTAQLRNDIPTREQYVKARQHYDQEAEKHYPWLRDAKQGDGAMAEAVIARYPQLRVLPNYRLVVANAMQANKLMQRGVVIDDALIERLAKEKEGKKPATPAKAAAGTKAPLRKPPHAPARAGTMPPRTAPRAAQVRAAEDRLTRADASMDDLAASIAAKL